MQRFLKQLLNKKVLYIHGTVYKHVRDDGRRQRVRSFLES